MHAVMCWVCVLTVRRQLCHSNVVELMGVVITVQPPSMILVSGRERGAGRGGCGMVPLTYVLLPTYMIVLYVLKHAPS